MKFSNSYWLYILAAIITIIGLVTGWYFFLLLVFPLTSFNFGKKKDDEDNS
ncbi:hypothetical protein SAMN05444483_103160 [Salegentibacter echinorum]|uniref:Uncharacterized protein n=1 Tax=Salegentibacter echinorum TaxID=1073325 RepID=A0A1M5FEM5_SALEC|nr:hypothetical protein [Salegentibacter echinorum]SHF90000.1 hypothetical protein SAMN05444483_103160 [Salegentibacter echinorum]